MTWAGQNWAATGTPSSRHLVSTDWPKKACAVPVFTLAHPHACPHAGPCSRDGTRCATALTNNSNRSMSASRLSTTGGPKKDERSKRGCARRQYPMVRRCFHSHHRRSRDGSGAGIGVRPRSLAPCQARAVEGITSVQLFCGESGVSCVFVNS